MVMYVALIFSFLIPQFGLASSGTKEAVSPQTAMQWLMNGNGRFTSTKLLRKDGQSFKDIQRLSKGQHPHTIVLSCSDSRVPPEIVFDQKLGEIFVIRTAGQALNDNAIGSIEYAVEHLGTKLIVVMGHTSCGAVTAAHSTLGGKSAGTPALDALVKDIHPRISSFKGEPSARFEKESWANAEGVAKDLTTRSSLLGEAFAKNELWIVPSMYDLNSGRVTFHERLRPGTSMRAPASQGEATFHSGH